MTTPIEILLAASNIGGQLGVRGDGLLMRLPRGTSPELKDAIRRHKDGLIALLRMDFLIVHSDALNATVFWTPNNSTKRALVSAGVDAGSVYSAEELATLVGHRVTTGELPTIHTARATFKGRLTDSQSRSSPEL